MKNLKRILSLALAGTMLVGMMMVGASAASFTDADKVEHKEAAETLAALGVMVGAAQPDGTTVFNPEGKLDRAAMAKMIAVIMNKGVDPLYADTDTPSFKDVKAGAWYVPYIEYCANLGYVNGYPQADGTKLFVPNGELTATEAARMILNAMGYKWDGTGSWELATEVQARDEKLDLYNGLDEIVTNKAMTRDAAAQMLFNALDKPLNNANVTEETAYKLTYTYTDKEGKEQEGTIDTFETSTDAYLYASLNGYKVKEVKKISTSVPESLASKNLNTKTVPNVTVSGVTYDAKAKTYTLGSYTTSVDLTQYMGQKVKILTKGNKVVGVVPTSTVLYTGVAGDIEKDDDKNKVLTIAGTKYDYKSNTITTWNTNTSVEPNDWDELIVIDNDGDKKIDAMVSRPVNVVKVTNVGKTSIVAGKTYTFKDNTIEDGLKAGNWVTVIDNDPYAGSTIAKIAVIENVQATAKSKDNIYTIGGKSYWSASGAKENKELKDVKLGTPYDLVAINGAVFEAKEYKDGTTATAGVDKLVYATRAVDPVAGKDDMGGATKTETQQVELLFTDNSKKIVTVTKVDTKPVSSKETKVAAKPDTLYTYTLDKKGNYELTTANEKTVLGELKGATVSAALKDGKIGASYINEDAVLFVQLTAKDKDDKDDIQVKVLTGAEVAKWTTVKNALTGYMYTESKNGFAYAAAGLIILDKANTTWPGSVSATKYGYITADAEEVYNAELKETMAELKIWNGAEEVTRQYKLGDKETLGMFVAGKMVSYTEGDKALASLAVLKAEADAVTGYAGGEDIILNTDKDVTTLKDVEIIFINDKDHKGVAASEATIQRAVANETVGTILVNNVYVAKDGTQVILFVDSENKVNVQVTVKAGTTALGKKDEAMTNAEMKKQADGVYAYAGTTAKDLGIDDFNTNGKNIVMKFTSVESADVTLTITGPKKGDKDFKYVETEKSMAAGPHFFVINTEELGNGGDAAMNDMTGEMPAGDYTFTIVAGDKTLLAGTFTVSR